MLRILVLIILMLVGAGACTSLRHPSARMPIPSEAESQITAINSPAEQPAQAQTSNNENSLPVATTFTAAQALQGQPRKAMPDAYASNDRKIVSQSWQKPLGLSKTVFKMADKQLTKAFKKRPAARDGTILGLRPVLFFALLVALAGVVLLFVAGKSQFFSILTLVLLISGLLVAVAAILEII